MTGNKFSVYIINRSSFDPGLMWHFLVLMLVLLFMTGIAFPYHSVLRSHIARERHHKSEISSCNHPVRHWESMTDRGQNVCVTWEWDCPNLCPQRTIFIWWVNTAPALNEHMLWPRFSILTIFCTVTSGSFPQLSGYLCCVSFPKINTFSSIVVFFSNNSYLNNVFWKRLCVQKRITSKDQLLPHAYNLLSGPRSEHCLVSIERLLMSLNRIMEEQLSCWYNVIKH